MYDTDTITLHQELSGPTGATLVNDSNIKYIVGVSIQQSGTASTSEIKCGSSRVALNYGKDFPYNQISYRCQDTISVLKTGQDSASYIVSYVPRDLSLTTPLTISSSVSATINNQQFGMFTTSYILILFAIGVLIGFFALK